MRLLAERLEAEGLTVWYDDRTLKLGDRLRRSIDEGLAASRYGVCVLSPNFFSKHWPQLELDGLATKERNGEKVILPVLLDLGHEDVAGYSPTLADRMAVKASDGMDKVVAEIMDAIRG